MEKNKISKETANSFFENLDIYIKDNKQEYCTKFLDLGTKIVKMVFFSKEFYSFIEKQFTYSLKDYSENFDATIFMWQEENTDFFTSKILPDIEKRVFEFYLESYYSIKTSPVIVNLPGSKTFYANNAEKNQYYHAIQDFDLEQLAKQRHILVQHINKILSTDSGALTHAGVVGLNNKGALICSAQGGGKSSLVIQALVDGFDYVSDDYVNLQHIDGKLYASPIFSVTNLAPKMYDKLFDKLEKTRFLFNSASKDKYCLNLCGFFDKFKTNYPIEFCLYPNIVSDDEPSITECTSDEKGTAILNVLWSTIFQASEPNNVLFAKKLFNMLKDYNYYKINLCPDISKNSACLRDFTEKYTPAQNNIQLNSILVDAKSNNTFILDLSSFKIYRFNEFASEIYRRLLNGASKDDIINELKGIKNLSISVLDELDKLVNVINEKGFLNVSINNISQSTIDIKKIEKVHFQIWAMEFSSSGTIELISNMQYN